MTRGELVFEVARSLGLDDTAGSDELILMQRWVNRGIVDILKRTHCYVDVGTMSLISGVTDYRIDSSILVVDNITLPNTFGDPDELNVIDMHSLLRYLSTTLATTATPLVAAIEGTFLRVAPAPTSAALLTYFFVPKPTEITADGTTTSDALDPSSATYGGIPTEYHDAILAYMMWRGAEYDQQGGGFFRGKSFAPGSAFEGTYEERIKAIKKAHRRKSGRGMHAGYIGYPGRTGGPRRNDTYPR